jgi:two-component system nitrate/nitrite response regulator NarL
MKLLLADSHHLVREALACFLRQAEPGLEVVEATGFEDALELAQAGSFDIVVLERSIAGPGELRGLGRMIEQAGDARVVLLCPETNRRVAADALRLGAAGVILTDLRGSALVSALRLIVAGEVYVPPALLDDDGLLEAAGPAASFDDLIANLTRRELEVVRLLAEGLSNREIAARLGLAEVTVKLHLHNAFEKIGARSRSDAVRIALVRGLAPALP